MHLLYVDESGFDELGQDEYFVLGGVSSFERVPYHMAADVEVIQKDYFPSIAEPIEFRASAIWNGNGEPWESMKRPTRVELLRRVYRLIGEDRRGVALFGIALKKADYPKVSPIRKTCEELAGHFDAYLASLEVSDGQRERGLIIFDKSRHEKTVQAQIDELRTTGASFGKVRHLAEVPMFADSKTTRLLQLADFVAYAIYRRYERSDAQFFDMIVPRFSQSNGVLHGLVHINSNFRECYCQACLPRRTLSLGAATVA